MSNSSLTTLTKISPNRTSPRNHGIDTITIHCYVGQVTAAQGLEEFYSEKKGASCNYVVGRDGSIGLCVPETDRSWCSSNRENDNRAVTIETASDSKDSYKVTDEAYAALLDLVTDICRRNGAKKLLWFGDKEKTLTYTPKDGEMVMTVHRWFANKACPGNYLYNKHSEIATEVTRRLQNETEDDMDISKLTDDQILELANRLNTVLAGQEPSSWSEEDREWAENAGLIQGDEKGNKQYKAWTTRESMVTFLRRIVRMMKEG